MEDALLAAICAQPDDIAARLVFADYLLEQSDPAKRDRGEFILAQCRRAAGGLPGAEDAELRKREKELLEKHRDAWTAPIGWLVKNAAFTRGFPDRVTMTVDQFADKFGEVARVTPVARLHLRGVAGVLAELAEYEPFRGVVGLDLSREDFSTVGLREFLYSPHLSRLNYLNLADNSIGDAGAVLLAVSPVLPRLQFLGVSRCGITPPGVSRLLSRVGTGLRWLNLRGNPLSHGDWAESVLGRLPASLDPALRMSLEGQLGRYRLRKPDQTSPLMRLKLSPGFSRDVRLWVAALDTTASSRIVSAIRTYALPHEVRQAFASLCARRLEWGINRYGRGKPVPPVPPVSTPKELADLVQLVIDHSGGSADQVAVWLRDWLLRLLEQHHTGTLDPEGRTR